MRWQSKALLGGMLAIGLGAVLGRFATGGMSSVPDAVSYRRAGPAVANAPATLPIDADPSPAGGADTLPPADQSPVNAPGSDRSVPRSPENVIVQRGGVAQGSRPPIDILPRDPAAERADAANDRGGDDWRGDPRVAARPYVNRVDRQRRYDPGASADEPSDDSGDGQPIEPERP